MKFLNKLINLWSKVSRNFLDLNNSISLYSKKSLSLWGKTLNLSFVLKMKLRMKLITNFWIIIFWRFPKSFKLIWNTFDLQRIHWPILIFDLLIRDMWVLSSILRDSYRTIILYYKSSSSLLVKRKLCQSYAH